MLCDIELVTARMAFQPELEANLQAQIGKMSNSTDMELDSCSDSMEYTDIDTDMELDSEYMPTDTETDDESEMEY
jgi:hypothetical protein